MTTSSVPVRLRFRWIKSHSDVIFNQLDLMESESNVPSASTKSDTDNKEADHKEETHMKNKNANKRKHNCHQYTAKFPSKNYLENHIETDHDQNPVCQQCDGIFVNEESIEYHLVPNIAKHFWSKLFGTLL